MIEGPHPATHVIAGERQTGRTTKLVDLCAEHGGYLVVFGKREATRVFHEAKTRGKKIAFPLTYNEVVDGDCCGRGVGKLWIDNLLMFARAATCGVPVAGGTIEIPKPLEVRVHVRGNREVPERAGAVLDPSDCG